VRGRAITFALVVAAGCGDKAVGLELQLPKEAASWDTSCTQTIEVYTEGTDYPAQAGDYIGQTLDVTDHEPPTYADVATAVRGRFDVKIPDDGLLGVEMYGWNGPSGFFNNSAFPELVFYARTLYHGQDPMTIALVPNMDCRTSAVTVRPVELISLVTTKSCTQAADAVGTNPFISIGTFSPGLYKDYLFGWGGKNGAAVTNGIAAFMGSMKVGPGSCAVMFSSSDTAFGAACVNEERRCANAGEIESIMLDNTYAMNSLDTNIQQNLRGAIVGAVLDATNTPLPGATVDIGGAGEVVYVDLDTNGKRLVANTATATTASGMFIVYTNDLVPMKVTHAGTTKTITVGAQRTYDDGFRSPAGVVVTF
jgi:hypothetical protein